MASISKVKVKNVTYDIGGGSEIYIGNEQDAPESTELLIDSEDMDMLGSEVVDTLDGNETDKAPSVRAIKEDLNIYSTSEQRIGTWIDGRPIYRKVFIPTNYTANIGITINHNIANFDFAVNKGGIGIRRDGKNQVMTNSFGNNDDYNFDIFDISNTQFSYWIGRLMYDDYAITKLYLWLEYTKTTDAVS